MTEANANNSKSQASDIEQAISNISSFVQSNDDALYPLSYASKNILFKKDQISFCVFVPIFKTDKIQD